MGINGAGVYDALVAPDIGEEDFAAQDFAAAFDQEGDESELGGGEIKAAAFEFDAEVGAIDFKGIDGEDVRLDLLLAAAVEAFHTEDEFSGAEGFGDIVIGTEFEATDAVFGFSFCSEHEDSDFGSLREGFELAADFVTVESWKHQIQNDDIRAELPGHANPLGAGGGTADAESCPGEMIPDQIHHVAFVLDQKNRWLHDTLLEEGGGRGKVGFFRGKKMVNGEELCQKTQGP